MATVSLRALCGWVSRYVTRERINAPNVPIADASVDALRLVAKARFANPADGELEWHASTLTVDDFLTLKEFIMDDPFMPFHLRHFTCPDAFPKLTAGKINRDTWPMSLVTCGRPSAWECTECRGLLGNRLPCIYCGYAQKHV